MSRGGRDQPKLVLREMLQVRGAVCKTSGELRGAIGTHRSYPKRSVVGQYRRASTNERRTGYISRRLAPGDVLAGRARQAVNIGNTIVSETQTEVAVGRHRLEFQYRRRVARDLRTT